MLFLIDAAAKLAYGSLYSEELSPVPAFEHGETVVVTVGKVSSIPSPVDSRLFEPENLAGWTFRAALGQGFQLPVAGVWRIRSGIPLTAGLVTNGKQFKIVSFAAGDDFTNIGAASNATGVYFTATGTTPTTWTHASELQEVTGTITFNPSAAQLQTALNATAWVAAAGGLTVSGATGYFYFTFTTAGAQAQMLGDADNLAPLSIADFSTLIDGSTLYAEVQTVQLVQNPAAFVSLTLANTPAGAGVLKLQTGGGGLNAKYRLSFNYRTSGLLITGATYQVVAFDAGDDFTNVGGTNTTGATFTATGTTPTTWTNGSALIRAASELSIPYDGQFSITVRGVESAMLDFDSTQDAVTAALEGLSLTSGTVVNGARYKIVSFAAGDDFTNIGGTNATGNVFNATGTTPTTWTHGSVVTPTGAGNVNVSREAAGQYLITFQGDMANKDMGVVTTDGTALKVIPTLSGVLDLRTAGIELLLAGQDSIAVAFEIEGTPPGGAVRKLFRADASLLDSIIGPASTSPPVTNQGYVYIGQFARLIPITGGFTIQRSDDGSTWQDVTSYGP